MYIQEKIKESIDNALKNIEISDISFIVEHPTDLTHGDYATNVALTAFSKIVNEATPETFKSREVIFGNGTRNPAILAQIIARKIVDQNIPEIEAVDIAGPGFINFTLAPEFFNQSIVEILDHEKDFGNITVHAGKKILIEHSSPNLFKPFHIGHMMNNAIGESLVRLMKSSGAEVTAMSFPSDISLGIAKAIFVILDLYPGADIGLPNTINRNSFKKVPNIISIDILGDAYVQGTKRYEEDESIHARVKEIADNLYAQKPSPEWDVFMACKKFNIEYFEWVTQQLGSEFKENYIFESEAGTVGKNIVNKFTPSVFTESQGATVYIPDELRKDINTSVFINSQGNPTYEAKDIGLIDLKFERFNPDISIFVTDHEQIPHFNVVLAAYTDIEKERKSNHEESYDAVVKSKHVPHGRMSLKGQKMSSRLGGVPLAMDMITTVSQEVTERAKDRELDQATKDAIAIAAIKFTILRAKPGMNINFDPETSLSFEGDSGPYLQYTHARIQTLIEKAKEQGIDPQLQSGNEISDLEKIMYRFPEVVELAVIEYAPNYIVTYLLEIARAFNSFYGSHKIIDSDNQEVSAHRVAIARSTQIILKNGLHMLGIHAPERM